MTSRGGLRGGPRGVPAGGPGGPPGGTPLQKSYRVTAFPPNTIASFAPRIRSLLRGAPGPPPGAPPGPFFRIFGVFWDFRRKSTIFRKIGVFPEIGGFPEILEKSEKFPIFWDFLCAHKNLHIEGLPSIGILCPRIKFSEEGCC